MTLLPRVRERISGQNLVVSKNAPGPLPNVGGDEALLPRFWIERRHAALVHAELAAEGIFRKEDTSVCEALVRISPRRRRVPVFEGVPTRRGRVHVERALEGVEPVFQSEELEQPKLLQVAGVEGVAGENNARSQRTTAESGKLGERAVHSVTLMLTFVPS